MIKLPLLDRLPFRRATLSEFHDRHYSLLYGYIAFRTGDGQAAEELAGEAFQRLLAEPKANKQLAAPTRQWLLNMVTHLVKEYHQSSPAAAAAGGATRHLATGLSDEAIRQVVAILPEEQQAVLALRYGCHLATSEIAQLLGEDEQKVKQWQARAIVALHRGILPQVRD
ncbi:MAG: sigma-70 family RNA polymerase sigma factor [Chloroflexi bacterium]|nr:sigma-70 family RNA polymerase sigma factor [Chloroflexota bacterium]MCI0574893.1 sigma-70 family RNA polymerase sigma factor [Chloroflexota bacterium]MCI0648395.1 sigma-70 family RNA polymerase sigma factor [Chloroflexota bacterium]MCI0727516.1 sigma-70 family RNA polymerase sigma factor [Chloroflexota bacterium]